MSRTNTSVHATVAYTGRRRRIQTEGMSLLPGSAGFVLIRIYQIEALDWSLSGLGESEEVIKP